MNELTTDKRLIQVPVRKLTISDFVRICQVKSFRLRLGKEALRNVDFSAAAVDKIVKKGKIVYGINTGVGDLCDSVISEKDLDTLQKNIILSHACGSAPYLDEDISRGALFLVINSRSKGFSGARSETLNKLIALFNGCVSPLLPLRGSLGASGDLIPLAHLGLLLLGDGKAYLKGAVIPAKKILRRLRLTPHEFKPKEALALINGTDVTASLAAFIVAGAFNIIFSTTAATAALFEIFGSSRASLDKNLHELKPHAGQVKIAQLLSKFTSDSKLCDCPSEKIQDSYVIRCAPQIDGAVLDQIRQSQKTIEIEINSVTDNPLFFTKGKRIKVVSGGNFHAQNMAFVLDSLAIALTSFSKVIERRIERLMNSHLSGLPPFLATKSGLNSGLMIPQYLVVSLIAENSVLAHPASTQSIPVSANQEDFVSMAMTSANKAYQILRNCENILAVEIMAVAQAMDLLMRTNGVTLSSFSKSAQRLYKKTRNAVPMIKSDRWMSKEIDTLTEFVRSGKFNPGCLI